MATAPHQGGAPALPILLFALATMERDELEQIAAAAIDRIDTIAGDPDLEPNGDEDDDPPEDGDSDRCLAGEDWMHGGPALLADAMGFTSTPSHYDVGMDEECEHNTAPCDIA